MNGCSLSATHNTRIEEQYCVRVLLQGDAKPAKNIATLVASCDGGCLAFWNALKGDLLGAFHAVGNEIGQDSVTSIAASADNTLLYTGDSLGVSAYFTVCDSVGVDGIT